jgi:hypothetical protein
MRIKFRLKNQEMIVGPKLKWENNIKMDVPFTGYRDLN